MTLQDFLEEKNIFTSFQSEWFSQKCISMRWFQYLLQFPNALILSYCMHKEVLESSLKQKDNQKWEWRKGSKFEEPGEEE